MTVAPVRGTPSDPFRTLLENSPEVIGRYDRHYRTLYVNASITAVTGLPPEHFIGRTLREAELPAELCDRWEAAVRRVLESGTPETIGWEFDTPMGPRWFESLLAPERHAAGDVETVAVFTRDVTEHHAADLGLRDSEEQRRRSEADLHERNLQLDLAMAAAQMAAWRWDPETDSLASTAGLGAIFGWPSDGPLPGLQDFLDRVHPHDRTLVAGRLDDILRRGGRYEIEFRIVWPDGSVRWIADLGEVFLDADGRATHVVGVAADITARRQAEEALRESEARFRSAFDNAQIAKAVIGADGCYVRVNRAFGRMLGYAPAELAGRTTASITHPDDRKADEESMRQAEAGRRDTVHADKRYLRKDGQVVWGRISTAVVRGDDGRPIHYITEVQDVTAQREMEAALRLSERRFRAMIEWASDPIAILDLSGRNVYSSPAHERILGYSPGELAGIDPLELVHPDDLAAAVEMLEALRREPGPIRVAELRFRHKQGQWRWLEVQGRNLADDPAVGGFVFNSRDVSDRHDAVTAIRASEARLAGIIGSAMDAIISVDEERRIVLFNAAAERMFGYAAAEVLGQPVEVLLPTRPREDQCGVRRDGSEFPIEATISEIEHEGRKIGTVVIRDVTERQRLETQLMQAQRMEAVGQLAGGLAHDFNNLLTAILSHADLALGELEPASPARADIAGIEHAGRRAAALTRQLLAFSRKQVLQARPVDLNQVVRESRSLLQRLAGEAVALETELVEGLPAIEADPAQLEQVLVNLVVNARDAMPGGGSIAIETGMTEVLPASARRADDPAPGTYVTLAVRDTGIGIPDDVLPHIFEPFYTTKPVGQGTGLGLSMVYGIVTQSGGQIRVESEPGRGTAITVLLPRTADSPQNRIAGPPLPRARGRETILLVEDEVAVRSSVRRVLERQGYTVLEARHGKDALLVWRDHGSRIDAVITDVRMPEMGGPQLVARLRADRPGLPVLFVSGYIGPQTGQPATDLDPEEAVLEKPFDIETLLEMVRKVIGQAGSD